MKHTWNIKRLNWYIEICYTYKIVYFQAVAKQTGLWQRLPGYSVFGVQPTACTVLRYLLVTGKRHRKLKNNCHIIFWLKQIISAHISNITWNVACFWQILKVLCETAVAVRTKAMKCLTAVVEADPGILARVCISIVLSLYSDLNKLI